MRTKEESMTVYGINELEQNKEVELFMSAQFTKTGRAKLLEQDLMKWGNRIFNLTIGEVIERFELSYKESQQIVYKYFKSESLPLELSKTTFTNNIFDYAIKEE